MYHFGVPGMINGLAVMRDDETMSLWDHITGECFEGDLQGARMDFWPIEITTVAAELASNPDIILIHSDSRSLKLRFMNAVIGSKFIDAELNLSGLNRIQKTMNGEPDPRLPERMQGLGVMDREHRAKFYPMNSLDKGETLKDSWLGRPLTITRDAVSGVPRAKWGDAEDAPMQLLTRWYGFAFTYPDCDIYEG